MPWPAIVGGAIAAGAIGGLASDYFNYKAQGDKLAYDKKIQQQIFQREDNAHQRAVADMRAAGLNPVLAAGAGSGAGAVIKTEAPQIGTNLSSIGDKALSAMMAMKMKADISLTEAQKKLIEQQALSTESQRGLTSIQQGLVEQQQNEAATRNKFTAETVQAENAGKRAAAVSARAQAGLTDVQRKRQLIDLINAQRTGMASNSPWAAIVRDLSGYTEAQLQFIYNGMSSGAGVEYIRNNSQNFFPPSWVNWWERTQNLNYNQNKQRR